jgi:hypothetical protein
MAPPATSVNVDFAQVNKRAVPAFAPRDLEGVVARTVRSARAQGRDYMSQSRAAAQAVMAVRPDMSLGQALDVVERLRVS